MRSDTDLARWLDAITPIDPVLREPLDIHGSARRRTQATTLLRELGFDRRIDERRVSDSTLRVGVLMLGPLADAVEHRRINVRERAQSITWCRDPDSTQGNLPLPAAIQAISDLGWSHHTVPGGAIRDVTDTIGRVYVAQMTDRVIRLLRRWERTGIVSDTAA